MFLHLQDFCRSISLPWLLTWLMVVVCNTSQQQHPEERVIIQHISQMNPNEDVRLDCSEKKKSVSVWVPLFISGIFKTPSIFTMVYIFGTMLFGGEQHRGWVFQNDSEAVGRLGDVKNRSYFSRFWWMGLYRVSHASIIYCPHICIYIMTIYTYIYMYIHITV